MFRLPAITAVLAGLLGVFLLPAPGVDDAQAAPVNGLANHRAIYDLSLRSASERSGIDGMAGRMVYEFNGSACDGYTVRFRFVTRIDFDSESRVTDQQTTTYEDVKKNLFRFVTRSYVNDTLDQTVSGKASGGDDGLTVDLEEPDAEHLQLPASRFPTQHMLELIRHAKAGDKVYQSRIFDGSDEAKESMITTTVLGEKRKAKTGDAEAGSAGKLANQSFWPVSIAYFEGKPNADETPAYRTSFKLYDDGVTRDLVMDYGDFVLKGTLADIAFFNAPECDG